LPFGSAAASIAVDAAKVRAYDERRPEPSEAELKKIADEADRANVYGIGNSTSVGIGAKGHESANHFAAILKAEHQGRERPGTHARLVAELWKRDPEKAKALNLPEPQRAGA
jgi:hypothetical protein